MKNNPLICRDLAHVWHPCSHMHDFEHAPPLVVHSAQGSIIQTDRGPLIDGIASWWCKSLGHGHPRVMAAIAQQMQRFEHVISANTTHPAVVELAEHLSALSKKQHVFFASDGSSAVEIALKLALHACGLKGQPEKNQFIALHRAYHGETLATLSLSDLPGFKIATPGFNLPCHWLHDIPYVTDTSDPLWSDCSSVWAAQQVYLDAIKHAVCAIIVEPIVQGAGGMLIYSADFLRRLAAWARQNDIYFIVDEIMTGLGRTGQWLASDHAGIEADLVCLSKGLTSGTLPLSCVMIDHSLFALCNDKNNPSASFLHSHTFSGHPLAVCAALATLEVMESENINAQASALGEYMRKGFEQVAVSTKKLTNIRSIGALVAGDLIAPPNTRLGAVVAQEAIKHGALLRPIGQTLYWLPPLNTDHSTIDRLAQSTHRAILSAYAQPLSPSLCNALA